MTKYSQKWHNGTSKTRSTKTFDGLVAIQGQLNNPGREIKKVNEKVYAAQVGCELCKGPHYTKDLSYLKRIRMKTIGKFMIESGKERHEENSLIKEILASTNAAIRNLGASIKTLEIQIGQMSKVLQERGFRSLPSSTETNPRDHVKSISTTVEADMTPIHCIESYQYAISPNKTVKLIFESLANRETLVLNRSQDPLYGDYIELNDLNVSLELKRDQVDDLMPTIEECEWKIWMATEIKTWEMSFFGEPFCKASCVEVRRFDRLITIHNGNDNVTYQMGRSHTRFKYLSNAQCNKIRPLLKVSVHDKLNGISHPYQKLKSFYKGS
ncbi:hypothetical protein Tco_1202684 [Tanacetum coccineum]